MKVLHINQKCEAFIVDWYWICEEAWDVHCDMGGMCVCVCVCVLERGLNMHMCVLRWYGMGCLAFLQLWWTDVCHLYVCMCVCMCECVCFCVCMCCVCVCVCVCICFGEIEFYCCDWLVLNEWAWTLCSDKEGIQCLPCYHDGWAGGDAM